MSNLLISYHATSEAKGGCLSQALPPKSPQRGPDDLSIRRSPVSRVHTKAGPPFVNRLSTQPNPAGGKTWGRGLVETRQAPKPLAVTRRTSVPTHSVGWLLRLSEFSSPGRAEGRGG